MTDREYLTWIHDRLECVHKENPHVDYMCKLRAIILATPPEQRTPNTCVCNNSNELIHKVLLPFQTEI